MNRNTARFLALAAALFACASAAKAAVVISAGKTRHMNCSAGVCTPTAKKATLNTGDLANMLAGGDVKIATGNGAVSITVMDSFSWTGVSRLTFDAQQNVSFHAPVTVAGPGAVTITTGDGIAGGTLVFFPGGSVDFWDNTSSLIINATNYALVSDIATLASDIAANPSGAYALAKDYDASADGTYAQAPIQTSLTGAFAGLGHTISHLAIDDNQGIDSVGLFTDIGNGGSVRDLALASVNIAGNETEVASLAADVETGATVADVSASGSVSGAGALVGFNGGTIVDSSADVAMIGQAGLVRSNAGTILRCHATGSVTDPSTMQTGGLVAVSDGTIQDSYATGSVNSAAGGQFGGEDALVGGLVGRNIGSISGSFATGKITVQGVSNSARNNHSFDAVGGLVGWGSDGTVADSYATGDIVFVGNSHTKANRVGGLVGEADVPVLRSYSTGHVSAKKARNGGLAGTAPASGMSDDYWDLDTSGINDPTRGAGSPANDPGITGLTTAQFQSGLPSGFDPAVWAQSASVNNGYPYLIANPPQ